MPYDQIIIDSYNVAHRLFYIEQDRTLSIISKKLVYLSFIRRYMGYIDLLKSTFGTHGCKIFLLFDNPTSKQKLKHAVTQYSSNRIRYELDPEYKANRREEPKEFYNSIQFLKFSFSIKGPEYYTIRVPNLEADDLVKPIIIKYCGEGQTLMVSTDMDWCRYLSPFVHILMGNIHEPILTVSDFKIRFGFQPTEEKIILYKILFGDASDNLKSIFPDIPKEVRQNILEVCQTTDDLFLNLPSAFVEYKPLINQRRKDVKIAYQLLAAISLEQSKLDTYIVRGRKAVRLQEIVDKIFIDFSERKTTKEFTFGKLKIPRL